MRYVKINETYAINADRIVDVSFTPGGYGEEKADGWGERIQAKAIIRIAGAVEVEERTLEGNAAEDFWNNLIGGSDR